jgi:hypothetical protein
MLNPNEDGCCIIPNAFPLWFPIRPSSRHLPGPRGCHSGVQREPPPVLNSRLPVDARHDFLKIDVVITIFCDFRQFSAKKLAFFSKTNAMIKILHNLALFRVKNAIFFSEIFGENI